MTAFKNAIVGVAALLLAVAAPALAQEKHDSNTLHKLGNAIQYPVRKAGENTSKTAHKTGKAIQYPVRKAGENTAVAAHQATGKESVIRRRNKRVNRKVTAGGRLTTMHGKTMTQLKREREAAYRRRHHRM